MGGEGGVIFGVKAVGEGRGCDRKVRDINVEFIRGGSVGNENAVGPDGVEMGEVVETDGLGFCNIFSYGWNGNQGANIPEVTSGPGV